MDKIKVSNFIFFFLFGKKYEILIKCTRLPDNDTDALSSMLMSWYISGFHTGNYFI